MGITTSSPVLMFSEPVQRRYYAPFCSIACWLNTLVILGAAILPVYISWASYGFWIRQEYRVEQPDVGYQSAVLVQFEGTRQASTGDRVPFTAMWSTSAAANSLLGDASRACILRSSTVDSNYDGLVDELKLAVSLPLTPDETVSAASILVWVNADFKIATRASFDSLLTARVTGGVPGAGALVDGDVRLLQRDSLPFPYAGVYAPYKNSPLLDLNDVTSVQQLSAASILTQYRQRNYTLTLDAPMPVWYPESSYVPDSGTDLSALATSPRAFKLEVLARVPPVPLLVRPGVSQELKHGWIQYMSFLPLTVLLAWLVRYALFRWRVVDTLTVDQPRTLKVD